jgi:geranylgeranyl diphosphate synthase type II
MFDLQTYLADGARWIEAALDRLVPRRHRRRPHAAMRHSLFAGGKRLRPILCAACAEACGAPRAAALFPAAAIECLHTYTLIHDDLPCMDDDDLRRGVPTATRSTAKPRRSSRATPCGARFELAAQTHRRRAGNVRELATAAGPCGVVGGQVEDMPASICRPTKAGCGSSSSTRPAI